MPCDYCGKIFQNLKKKTSHVNIQHLSKGVNCKVCNKHFLRKSRLMEHTKNIHLKQRSAICKICDKQFRDFRNMQKHVAKVHERARPFGCEKCAYKASSLFNLNLHRSKMHDLNEKLSFKDYSNDVINGSHPSIGKEMLPLLKLLY